MLKAIFAVGLLLCASRAWAQPVIERTYKESKPAWAALPQAPAGAPNVIYLVLDDVGFAQLGCYGSAMNTPNLDKLAAGGLRYTNFCSRAGKNVEKLTAVAFHETDQVWARNGASLPRRYCT